MVIESATRIKLRTPCVCIDSNTLCRKAITFFSVKRSLYRELFIDLLTDICVLVVLIISSTCWNLQIILLTTNELLYTREFARCLVFMRFCNKCRQAVPDTVPEQWSGARPTRPRHQRRPQATEFFLT